MIALVDHRENLICFMVLDPVTDEYQILRVPHDEYHELVAAKTARRLSKVMILLLIAGICFFIIQWYVAVAFVGIHIFGILVGCGIALRRYSAESSAIFKGLRNEPSELY